MHTPNGTVDEAASLYLGLLETRGRGFEGRVFPAKPLVLCDLGGELLLTGGELLLHGSLCRRASCDLLEAREVPNLCRRSSMAR